MIILDCSFYEPVHNKMSRAGQGRGVERATKAGERVSHTRITPIALRAFRIGKKKPTVLQSMII